MGVEKLTTLKYTHFQSERLQWYESRLFFLVPGDQIFSKVHNRQLTTKTHSPDTLIIT